ncbi:MAG: hypothetical protein Q9170_003373 [Blastenia crenularia]
MAAYNYKLREKENAKEWQIKEEAGVQKGNVHSYFNEWVEEDQTSESASEAPSSQVGPPSASLKGRARPAAPNPTQFQKANFNRPPGKPKHKQAITFARKRDNAAKVAYRTGQRPSAAFDLKGPLTAFEPSVARLQLTFEEIGVRVGSFVLPRRALQDSEVLIWGNQKQVEATISELKRWRSQARTWQSGKESRSKDQFAKISSVIGPNWAALEATAKRDAERQHYQKAPAQGQSFKSNGYFLWPNNEIRAIDLFGPHCEALDPLRVEFRVHILFDQARSVFKIHSQRKGAERVNHVIRRIENTIKEYVARDHRPATLLLIEPPGSAEYRPNVRTIAGPFLGINRAQSKIPILLGEKSDAEDDTDLERKVEMSISRNKNRTYVATQKVLERIPYYRGYLRMRVNFGTFALVKFQWPPGLPCVTLEKFTEDVQSAGTKGTLIRK